MAQPRATPSPDALPNGLRRATLFCLLLAAFVGLFSASEAASLSNLSALQEAPARGSSLFGDPALMEKASAAQLQAYTAALRPMQASRGFVLGGLAVACGLIFVSAGRLLRPAGLPRNGMRGLLGGAALAAAMLRAVDGAQMAVVAQRVGLAAGKVLIGAEPYSADPEAYQGLPKMISGVLAGVSVLHTALVAGGLLALALYFRSEKVKQIVTFRDGQLE